MRLFGVCVKLAALPTLITVIIKFFRKFHSTMKGKRPLIEEVRIRIRIKVRQQLMLNRNFTVPSSANVGLNQILHKIQARRISGEKIADRQSLVIGVPKDFSSAEEVRYQQGIALINQYFREEKLLSQHTINTHAKFAYCMAPPN